MLNHPSLEWLTLGPRTLRVRDRKDRSGASAEMDLDDTGLPACFRADRPRTVGKKVVATPWSARGWDIREREGLRVWTHLEAAWHLHEGPFTYVRMELTSFTVLKD